MSLIPNVVGIETSDGSDANAALPDGTRQLMVLRLPAEMTAAATIDGSVTRIALAFDADKLAGIGPDGAYQYAQRGTTTLAAGASATQLDSYEHGLTDGLLTIEAWCEAIDSDGDSALYSYTQQWVVASEALSLVRNPNPTEEGEASSWPFAIYDAGSGAIAIRTTPDGTNNTRFKWEWRVSAVAQPS